MLASVWPSWPTDPRKTFAAFSLYAKYTKENVASLCPDLPQDACFGTDEYEGEGLEDSAWRSWSYQFCTEWGYFMGVSSVLAVQDGPR